MQNNVINLRNRPPLEEPRVCPAQYYTFTGDPRAALLSNAFMEKAAVFQEIRDSLIAVDYNELPAHDAERHIQFLVRTYLNTRLR